MSKTPRTLADAYKPIRAILNPVAEAFFIHLIWNIRSINLLYINAMCKFVTTVTNSNSAHIIESYDI